MAISFLRSLPVITALSCTTYFASLQPVHAEESFTANAGVASNYVFRGQTQTDDSIAAQGGVDYTHASEFYVGAWTSNVKNTTGGSGLEVDLYGGWAHSWDDFGIDIGYIIYEYTDSNFAGGAKELYVGFDWGPAGITYYSGSDDTAGASDYNYIDVGLDIELVEDVLLAIHYGRFSPDVGSSFNDVKVEVSKTVLDFDVALAVTYEDGTSNNTTSKDSVFLVTVKRTFDL